MNGQPPLALRAIMRTAGLREQIHDAAEEVFARSRPVVRRGTPAGGLVTLQERVQCMHDP
jgi:hypothetical protein